MPERHPGQGSVAEADAATPAALRQQGLRRLQSDALPEAIQILARAVALDPNDATAGNAAILAELKSKPAAESEGAPAASASSSPRDRVGNTGRGDTR
jgi:beta-phosphoglucomutase-like phosphatase (HAD superfamily)